VLLTKLTSSQETLLTDIVSKYQANALSSNTDIAGAEHAVSDIFGGKPPEMVWTDLPFYQSTSGSMGVFSAREYSGSTRAYAENRAFQLLDTIGQCDYLSTSVSRHVTTKLRLTSLMNIQYYTYTRYIATVKKPVVLPSMNKLAVSLDNHWGYYEFISMINKDPALDAIQPFIRLQEMCGGAFMVDNRVYLYPKPKHMHVDTNRMAHSNNSPAISYGEFNIYAWHGVEVPEKVIMRPNDITPNDILTERNATLARIKLEQLTVPNFFAKAKVKIEDSDSDSAGNTRNLLSIPLLNPGWGDPCIKCVQVICPSTNKTYLLRVPPAIRTCHEAIAWTFNMDVKDYAPAIEQ
jgi:hypothetical protein